MRTLKQWRELRGLTREDLAERTGIPVEAIERWEEAGFDIKPGSRAGDLLMGKLMDALDAGEGMRADYVPDAPEPGDLIITPSPGAGALMEEIIERAGELDLRMCVPDRWGQSLKPPKDLSDEDEAAISEHFERESAYAAAVSERMGAALEILGGNDGSWREGQTMGERLEEVDRELADSLDMQTGGEHE